MSESKMKPRLRAEELTGMISLLRDKFVRSQNLRRCCFVPIRRNSVLDGLRSSLFKFIQERNVSESGGKCFKRLSRICRSERDVQLGVISVQMIFEGIFLDHRAKRSSIESKKQWAKYGTLGYTTGKSRECRDGIID